MESLSIWSLAGVVSNSAVIMAVHLSTQRVWHTFNYDVTVSNGVNLSHPVHPQIKFSRAPCGLAQAGSREKLSGRPGLGTRLLAERLRECAVRLRVQSSHAPVRSLKVFFPVAVFYRSCCRTFREIWKTSRKRSAP